MKLPELELYDHQETITLDLDALTAGAVRALPLVLACPVPPGCASVLAELETVEVSFISDEEIARVHGEFLDDPTPTDVITFEHGELLISADTAARCAGEYGHTTQQEALLYLIHGLLHLHGYDDHEPTDRTAMHDAQQRILDTVNM